MLEKNEARHLQNLLRLCQQNIPVTVRQAAVQQNLPDLPRLWAFMQMCDMAKLSNQMTGRQFRRAGKDVLDFANSMRKAMSGENFNSQVQNQPLQNQQSQPQAQAQQQEPMSPEEFIAQQKQVRQQMYDARMQIMRQPMENSPRAMDTMKNLAQFLMKNTPESQRNTALLQNFINNNGQMLEKNEARHLQNLLRLCQQNIPVTVRQAAKCAIWQGSQAK